MERPRFFPVQLSGNEHISGLTERFPSTDVNYILLPNHPNVANPFQLRDVRNLLDPNHQLPAYGFFTDHFLNTDRPYVSRAITFVAAKALDSQLIPVPQESRKDRSTTGSHEGGIRNTLKVTKRILEENPKGNIFVLFPEGQGSVNGVVGEVSKGVVSLMKRLSPAVVIPIGISADRSTRFYVPHPLRTTELVIGKPYKVEKELTGERVRDSLTSLL